jgi:hypothetical protein
MTSVFTERPWVVDPDALQSFLSIRFSVAHPLTNENILPVAEEREGKILVSFQFTPTSSLPYPYLFYKVGKNCMPSGCEPRSCWGKEGSKMIKM